jgi:hypothetical protein
MNVAAIGAPSAGSLITPAASATGAVPALPAATSSQASGFEAALARAGAPPPGAPAADSSMLRSVMKPLDQMDDQAASIARKAAQFVSGTEMTPGDMIMMTVRCQEFMFQCQLTSNVANRTSDGLQQLFRQQG